MTQDLVIDSKIGRIYFECYQGQVNRIHLNSDRTVSQTSCQLHADIIRQFDCYFKDPSFEFFLPVTQNGTSHQQRVWQCLKDIPRGAVRTYGAVASEIGSSAQAVGNACRHNSLPVIVPCHRVVAASAIGGFAGAIGGQLVDIKQSLLAHEGVNY